MNLPRASAAANRLLRRYGSSEPPIPVEHIAEREGVHVAYHNMEDGVSGLLLREGDKSLIAVNVKHPLNRQRFTIAHELGHAKLHQATPTVFIDHLLVHFRAERTTEHFDPREAEANLFAATLLMPRRLLHEDLMSAPVDISDEKSVRTLAQRYQVSQQALTIRLVNLRLVSN